tara:strand:+ start:6033 stop:6419 length:387 start_codon:yes stop_codon:yes gene_type:complete
MRNKLTSELRITIYGEVLNDLKLDQKETQITNRKEIIERLGIEPYDNFKHSYHKFCSLVGLPKVSVPFDTIFWEGLLALQRFDQNIDKSGTLMHKTLIFVYDAQSDCFEATFCLPMGGIVNNSLWDDN